MNQYLVTFSISVAAEEQALIWARKILRPIIQYTDENASIVSITERSTETHYGGVLAELEQERQEDKEQNSADDSLRSFDDALGQGRC